MLLMQEMETSGSDDLSVEPLVIDTSMTAESQTVVESELEPGSRDHDSDVDPDLITQSSVSESCPITPPCSVDAVPAPASEAVLLVGSETVPPPGSECCDEVDDMEDLSERHHDGSLSSDSQSTIGSAASKDLSSSDLSPGATARCSKSRRKSDRVSTTTS